jgi:hypothetical protein
MGMYADMRKRNLAQDLRAASLKINPRQQHPNTVQIAIAPRMPDSAKVDFDNYQRIMAFK